MSETAKDVLVIYTGGTIGMAPQDPTNSASPLVPKSDEDLKQYLPREDRVGVTWRVVPLTDDKGELVGAIDSSDLNAKHWKYIAGMIGENYEQYMGFCVLQGTDTMAFTTSALSFMFENLAKPVVVTGSQLPISHPRTDAITNFVNSVLIAGWRSSELPRIPEVVLCFADVILRGNRARKLSSYSWRGFESPNLPPLGMIGEHIVIDTDALRPVLDNDRYPFYVKPGLGENVIDIGLFPALQASQLGAILRIDNLRGVILRTFGAGNAPSDEEFLKEIEEAVQDRGVVIVNVSQCVEGKVEAGLYEASSALLERGVLSGLDITPEAALTKLMALLENTAADQIHVQMQIDQAGEISESLFDLRYGQAVEESSPGKGKGRRPVLVLVGTDGRVTGTASPAGSFSHADLTRAQLRVSRVTTEKAGREVRVYVNHPNATSDAGTSDPRYACSFIASDEPQARDITATIQKVVDDRSGVTLTLVCPDGGPIEAEGLSVALFAAARHG